MKREAKIRLEKLIQSLSREKDNLEVIIMDENSNYATLSDVAQNYKKGENIIETIIMLEDVYTFLRHAIREITLVLSRW
jgi:glycosyltransferase involved in cell wall biosynthesis